MPQNWGGVVYDVFQELSRAEGTMLTIAVTAIKPSPAGAMEIAPGPQEPAHINLRKDIKPKSGNFEASHVTNLLSCFHTNPK